MTNYQVAEAFAMGASTGRSDNMFIEGNVIYSYGYHFKIAERLADKILFTTRKYSRTTGRHKSYVLTALKMQGLKIEEAVL